MTGLVIGAAPQGVAVLINSTDPDSAAFGWFITGDQTTQTLHAYAPASPGVAAVCVVSPLSGDVFVPGFSMCPGAPNSLFPIYGASYGLGGSAVMVNVYAQPPSGSRANFLPATAGCAPVSILSVNSPFGTGAWSVEIEQGSAQPPPARYFSMPSYCA